MFPIVIKYCNQYILYYVNVLLKLSFIITVIMLLFVYRDNMIIDYSI